MPPYESHVTNAIQENIQEQLITHFLTVLFHVAMFDGQIVMSDVLFPFSSQFGLRERSLVFSRDSTKNKIVVIFEYHRIFFLCVCGLPRLININIYTIGCPLETVN